MTHCNSSADLRISDRWVHAHVQRMTMVWILTLLGKTSAVWCKEDKLLDPLVQMMMMVRRLTLSAASGGQPGGYRRTNAW